MLSSAKVYTSSAHLLHGLAVRHQRLRLAGDRGEEESEGDRFY
jgi:hypothetical protein